MRADGLNEPEADYLKTEQPTILSPLWAILWRSFVYFPFMFVFMLILIAMLVGMIALPIYGAVLGYFNFWGWSLAAFAAWGTDFWIWRRFRLRKFFEGGFSPF
jgi:hypothetical protein